MNDFAYHVSGADYFYPAVAVNSGDNKTMVFSRSSTTEFASTRYVGIRSMSSGCTGTNCIDGPETVLQNGQNSYVNLLNNRNRWGDYMGASPDPDGTGVWVAGEFAAATQNTWGVQVGLTYEGAPLIPSNDDFANAQTISGSATSVSGTTRSATREFSEPDHYVTSPPDSDLWVGDHSVWYRWTASASGSTTVDTCTTNIDSILAVYTGSSLGSLNRVADNNNACPSGWGSKVTFNAVAGTTYRIAVGDAGGLRQSAFTLKVVDSSAPETTITGGPSGPTNDDTPTFTFRGSDNATPSSNLRFSYKVDDGAWSPFQTATSATLGGTTGLSDGPHTFFVKARDAAGNEDASPAQRSFTVDTVNPRVVRVVPAENATDIAPATNVLVFFSEAMRPGTINSNTVKLFKAGTTSAIGATVTYDQTTKEATLDPNANLRRGVRYRAEVTTGARDLATNQLDQNPTITGLQPKKWTFTIRT